MTNPNPQRSSARFTLSDLPKSQRCDIRTTYIEKNLTLSELVDINKCDTCTLANTEFNISYTNLYLECLCHYWPITAKSRETRVSLLPMLFLELSPICLEDEENLITSQS